MNKDKGNRIQTYQCCVCLEDFQTINDVPQTIYTKSKEKGENGRLKRGVTNAIIVCPLLIKSDDESGTTEGNKVCGNAICCTCYKTWLLDNINEPHCEGCDGVWTKEFLYTTKLTKTWVDNVYYGDYRKNLQLDRQKAMLTDTMHKLPNFDYTNRDKIEKKLNDERQDINKVIDEKVKIINEVRREIDKLEGLKQKIRDERYKIKRYYNPECLSKGIDKDIHFICKCPYETTEGSCNGMIQSHNFKCKMCEQTICRMCRQPNQQITIIDKEKGIKQVQKHVCKDEDVETIKLLRNDTKPCPKCAVPIHKLEGCRQMWCTVCHALFDWKTGKFESMKNVHNPHALRYLRENNQLDRNPLDIPCGGLIRIVQIKCLEYIYRKIYPSSATEASSASVTEASTSTVETVQTEKPMSHLFNNLRSVVIKSTDNITHNQPNENEYEHLRFYYLTKQITEDEWKEKIFITERKNNRLKAKIDLWQMIQTFIPERLRNIYENICNIIKDAVNVELNDLLIDRYGQDQSRYVWYRSVNSLINEVLSQETRDRIVTEYDTFFTECDKIRIIVNDGFADLQKIHGGGKTKYNEVWGRY